MTKIVKGLITTLALIVMVLSILFCTPSVSHATDEVVSTVKMIQVMNPEISNNLAGEIALYAQKYAEEHNLPVLFVLTIIKTESEFIPTIRGKSGDSGLMQIIPRYHKKRMKRLGVTPEELFNVDENIMVGCDILGETAKGRTDDKSLKVAALRFNGRSSYANKIMRRYRHWRSKF